MFLYVFVSDLKFSIAFDNRSRHSCYRINTRIYFERSVFAKWILISAGLISYFCLILQAKEIKWNSKGHPRRYYRLHSADQNPSSILCSRV